MMVVPFLLFLFWPILWAQDVWQPWQASIQFAPLAELSSGCRLWSDPYQVGVFAPNPTAATTEFADSLSVFLTPLANVFNNASSFDHLFDTFEAMSTEPRKKVVVLLYGDVSEITTTLNSETFALIASVGLRVIAVKVNGNSYDTPVVSKISHMPGSFVFVGPLGEMVNIVGSAILELPGHDCIVSGYGNVLTFDGQYYSHQNAGVHGLILSESLTVLGLFVPCGKAVTCLQGIFAETEPTSVAIWMHGEQLLVRQDIAGTVTYPTAGGFISPGQQITPGVTLRIDRFLTAAHTYPSSSI